MTRLICACGMTHFIQTVTTSPAATCNSYTPPKKLLGCGVSTLVPPFLFDSYHLLRTQVRFWFVPLTGEPELICAGFQCMGSTPTGFQEAFCAVFEATNPHACHDSPTLLIRDSLCFAVTTLLTHTRDVTRHIHMCDMTHSCVRHDSLHTHTHSGITPDSHM